MFTIRDVAKAAGVCPATVSRVINNSAPVNSETRKTILKTIDEMGFVPNPAAQTMRTKRNNTIGVIIPDYSNPFYYAIMEYLEKYAFQNGFRIMIVSAKENPRDDAFISTIAHQQLDGLIVHLYKGSNTSIINILELSKKLPVVFMDNIETNYQINKVHVNGRKGICDIIDYLVSIGRKNIGFISTAPNYHVAAERYQGYVDGLEKNSIKFDSDMVVTGDYSQQSGFLGAKTLIEEIRKPIDAFVSTSDIMATGAIAYFKENRISVPNDIAVTGFDNLNIAKFMTPSLTTYAQPVAEIAKNAIELIVSQVTGEINEHKKQQIILQGKLIIRESTDKNYILSDNING